jgi:hypothetical protein
MSANDAPPCALEFTIPDGVFVFRLVDSKGSYTYAISFRMFRLILAIIGRRIG